MIAAVAVLVAAALVIYFSAEFFTNAVEWLGLRMKLGQTATGTILAAIGTALPESAVTFVATAFATGPAQKSIGIGAALGGPLALATIAYAVIGATQFGRTPALLPSDNARLARNQTAFLMIFAVKIGLGLFLLSWKPVLGWGFILAYALYLHDELRHPADHPPEHDLEPLKLRPRSENPALGWILLQLGGAAAATYFASRLFVDRIELLAPALGFTPQLTALFISPIATELPETLNALIWVRQGKDRLALANVSGAMMIQATIPTAFGLFFTPWLLDRAMLLAAFATALAILSLLIRYRRGSASPAALIQAGLALPLLIGVLIFIG